MCAHHVLNHVWYAIVNEALSGIINQPQLLAAPSPYAHQSGEGLTRWRTKAHIIWSQIHSESITLRESHQRVQSVMRLGVKLTESHIHTQQSKAMRHTPFTSIQVNCFSTVTGQYPE
jgi:hypothetical protein